MSIINKSVPEPDFFGAPALFPDETAPVRQTIRGLVVQDFLEFDDSALSSLEWLNNVGDTLVFDEAALVFNNTKRFQVADTLTWLESAKTPRVRSFLVSDALVFADTIYDARKFKTLGDQLQIAEFVNLRFATIRRTVTDVWVVGETVFKTVNLNKANLKVGDKLTFSEVGTNQYLGVPLGDTLVFTETLDLWKPRLRPIASDTLVFTDSATRYKSKGSPSDKVTFKESVCVCLARAFTLGDTLGFSDSAHTNLDDPFGDLGNTDFDFIPTTWTRQRFERLNIREGFIVLKNGVDVSSRECCA